MSNKSEFTSLWDQILGAGRKNSPSLNRIQIDGIRGIHDLSIDFDYPVTVLAGENGCGKSTVLHAAACAFDPLPKHSGMDVVDNGKSHTVNSPDYEQMQATQMRFHPRRIFPTFTPETGDFRDRHPSGTIRYGLSSDKVIVEKQWTCNAGKWQKSYSPDRASSRLERLCFLRTMSDVAHPAELRHAMGMGLAVGGRHQLPTPSAMSIGQIKFGSSIVPHLQYREVIQLMMRSRNLLFAVRNDQTEYSELQMAGGERTALRVGLEISHLRNALVLIDEVEAGLHPRAQQLLMHGLQWLALHNNTQIIVSTHSPVVIDCVHPLGRKFLERATDSTVQVVEPYTDIIQDVLYGRPQRSFNILCEDNVAEGVLNGILDHIVPLQEWPRAGIQVVRNTGADEFPTHARAFAKCDLLDHFVFVLDGDQRDRPVITKLQAASDRPVIVLPGESPEQWVWERIEEHPTSYASLVGVTQRTLEDLMREAHSKFGKASNPPNEIYKAMLEDVAAGLSRPLPELCRIVSRHQIEQETSHLHPIALALRQAFEDWRRTYQRILAV